ncbi:MAG: SPOR domain-containing protein [Alphaproteobacteria bacterium]
MSDHERGAYTPPTGDAPLSFDPRRPVRGARPIPVTLILSVLVLAALVAAIFMFYRSGVRQAAEAPQIVGAPMGGIKAPATPETQPQDPAAGLQIYKADDSGAIGAAPPEPVFVPPPEQPQARPTAPLVVTQAPPAATVQALKPAIPAPAEITPPPAAKPAPLPAKATPATPKPAPVKPAPSPKVTPPAETKKPSAPEPKATSSSGAAVQIGAVSSTALADKAWNDAVAAAPGLGAGKGKSVEKIERNGGTLYRTAVTGFATKADAQAFCARLQAAGKSCFVR